MNRWGPWRYCEDGKYRRFNKETDEVQEAVSDHPYDAGYPRDDSAGCIYDDCGQTEELHLRSEYAEEDRAAAHLPDTEVGRPLPFCAPMG